MIRIWALLLLLTRLEAAVLSPLRPLTALEQAVPVWPPTAPWPLWLERVFIAPMARWDAHWYARIVAQGYQAGDGTTQFYPLYPMIAMPLAWLGLSPLAALTLVAITASAIALRWLEYLAREDMDPIRARIAAMGYLSFPAAFVLWAPYAEPLFLVGAIGSVHMARRGRWGAAGLLTALAVLARPQGLFLLLPLGWALWRRGAIRRGAHALLPGPLALAAWHAYRIGWVEGFLPMQAGINAWVYGWLFSPYAHRVVDVQSFRWPWEALAFAIEQFIESPDVDLGFNLIGAAWFLGLLALAWRGMAWEERLYTLAVTLSAFSYHTGPAHPYMGLLRHLWLAFPIFLGVARAHPRLARLVPVLQFPSLFLAVSLYVLEAWVP